MAPPRTSDSGHAHCLEPRWGLHRRPARGMTLAPPDTFQSISRLDVSLSLRFLPPLKDRAGCTSTLHDGTIAEVRLQGAKQVSAGIKVMRNSVCRAHAPLARDRLSSASFAGGHDRWGSRADAAPLARTKTKTKNGQDFLRCWSGAPRRRCSKPALRAEVRMAFAVAAGLGNRIACGIACH